MNKILFLLITTLCIPLMLTAGEVPDKLIHQRSGGGTNGYNYVKQKWIDTESEMTVGRIICRDAGEIKCEWVSGSGVGYPIDIDHYAELILTEYENGVNNGSGTMVVGETAFTYHVVESLGNTDGTVVFTFL